MSNEGIMATYFYQATTQTGKLIEGDVEALDHKVAVQKIRQMNYFPIQVTTEKSQKSLSQDFTLPFSSSSTISSGELLVFTQQLATLVSSKLTLDRSLSLAANMAKQIKSRALFQDLRNRVHSGSSFADALAAYPKVFSRMYINIVRAGEIGGFLDVVLQRMAEFLEKSRDVKAKIYTALIYPIILIVMGSGAVLFLMTNVIPKFTEIFKDMGDALPIITEVLLVVTTFVAGNIWTILLTTAAIAFGFALFLKTDTGKYWWDSLLLKLPVIGDLIRKREASRFSLTISTLLSSGVPILPSLLIVREAIDNQVVARSMGILHEGLKHGKGLSQPLSQIDTFPPLAAQMIQVGEETGQMEAMLVKVAAIFDKEVDVALQRAVGLIGPILILFLGGMIAFMVIGVLWGLLSISDIFI